MLGLTCRAFKAITRIRINIILARVSRDKWDDPKYVVIMSTDNDTAGNLGTFLSVKTEVGRDIDHH